MILADLPGPKIRIGKLKSDPLLLKKGDRVTLTTKDIRGTAERISVNYERLSESVARGSVIYLNDGFVQLQVEESAADEVICKVVIGGPLFSHKGLNLPGASISGSHRTTRKASLPRANQSQRRRLMVQSSFTETTSTQSGASYVALLTLGLTGLRYHFLRWIGAQQRLQQSRVFDLRVEP